MHEKSVIAMLALLGDKPWKNVFRQSACDQRQAQNLHETVETGIYK
jgi:hypothetical protein